MNNNNLISIILIISILNALIVGCIHQTNSNTDSIIQKYINEASEGDIIYIPTGLYYETIIINKSIHLIANNTDTILSCKNNMKEKNINIITINSDNCTIKGFKITAPKINNYSYYITGIKINSSKNKILNNDIYNTNKALDLEENTKYNSITNNNVTCNHIGINLYCSHRNNISNNNINSQTSLGISLQTSSNNNLLYANNISNNRFGIQISGSKDNFVIKNHITNNHRGMYLCCGAKNTTIYYNSFMNNIESNARDKTINNWFFNHTGNYWDDYDEPEEGAYDNNNNNIIDLPYNITGGNNQDKYPLIKPH